MALTELVITISNGHFEESIDAGGDQEGTSTGLTATTLTDTTQAWTTNFAGFRLVPNREDGASFSVISNTATAILVDGDMTTVATSGDAYRVGDGQAGRFDTESVSVEGDLNEPKTLTTTILADVVGAESAEDEGDKQNAIQLGARVQCWRGSVRWFDGHIVEDPVNLDADAREVSITAHDRLAVLDRSLVPATDAETGGATVAGTLRFNWDESTPLLEHRDAPMTKTLGFEDNTYAIDPVVIGIATSTTGTTGTTLVYSTGGFTTDRITDGCRVVNLTDNTETFVDSVDSDTQITTVGSGWNVGDKFLLFDKAWQFGEQETLSSVITATDTAIPLGTDWKGWGVRGWALIYDATTYELLYYDGYLETGANWGLTSYNAEEARDGRGDFGTTGLIWGSGVRIIEMYPNRFAGGLLLKKSGVAQDPKSFEVFPDIGVLIHATASVNYKATVSSYDGDANSTTGGTAGDALDIADVVDRVLKAPKEFGGPGFAVAEVDTNDTGLILNAVEYSPGKSQLHAKEVIDELASKSGHFYRLIWKDDAQQVLFESLTQKATADITLTAGSVVSLARERTLTDIRSAMLMTFKNQSENLFDPDLIRYHNSTSTVDFELEPNWKNASDSNVFQINTNVQGIWSDHETSGKKPQLSQHILMDDNTGSRPDDPYMVAVLFFTSAYDPITIDELSITLHRGETQNSPGGTFLFHGATNWNESTMWPSSVATADWEPLGLLTEKFLMPDDGLRITETTFWRKRINAIRVSYDPLGTERGRAGEHHGIESTYPPESAYTGNWSPLAGAIRSPFNGIAFGITDPIIKGDLTRAVFVRLEKADDSPPLPTKFVFPDSYKKIFPNAGHRVEVVDLGHASEAEAQSLGRQFLDDRLRQYQARDYSLKGKDPFVNGGDLPHLGQTLTIADDATFTGIITGFSFSQNAEGTTYDFRLEDYDRNRSAQYLRAVD